jgi:two-component system, NarL family, sensor histidine kinase DegS
VWVKLETVNLGVRLSVRDDGDGFQQVLEGPLYFPVKRRDGSLGMGLLGMQERIDLLNGSLEVDSKPHEGSRITAWIPCNR